MLRTGLCSSEATLGQGDTSLWPGSQESLSFDSGPFIFTDGVRRGVEARTGWGRQWADNPRFIVSLNY